MPTDLPPSASDGTARSQTPMAPLFARHPAARNLLLGATLLLVVLAIYSPIALCPNAQGKGFLWTDDYDLLLSNPAVRSPTGLALIWSGQKAVNTPSWDYFPLTITSFWVEYRLFGDFAMGYHLVSALLHAGSAILLWRVLKRLRVPGAYLAAILFAITPVNVESVAWIAERKNTLSMCLMCASLLLYVRFLDRRRVMEYFAALFCFLLALLAKTAPVMLPFILLLGAWWRRGRITRTDLLRAAPFFAVSLLLGLVTVYFQHTYAIGDVAIRSDSILSRICVAGTAVFFYLGSLLAPYPVYFNYPRWNLLGDYGYAAVLPMLALAGTLALLWLSRATPLRHAFAAMLAYILMLFPILGFVNVFYMRYSLVSDHWQYQASIFPLALCAAILVSLGRQRAWRMPVVSFSIVACVAMACYSFAVAGTYRNAEEVWTDTLARNPGSWLAYSQRGEIAREEAGVNPGELDKAIDDLRHMVQLRPDLADAYINLGQALAQGGRNADAVATFEAGLNAPAATLEDKKVLHLNAGAVLANAGKLPAAEAHLRAELQLDPDSPGGNFFLGRVLVQQDEMNTAKPYLQRAIDLGRPEAGRLLDQISAPATSRP